VAAVGVLVLIVGLGSLPWISLTLAVSFGLYGFVRKRAGLDVIVGLFVETSILAPFALAFVIALSLRGSAAFGAGAATTALLALAGPLTALPLLGFAKGVRSLRYSTMGLLQYVSPTGQFFLAVGLYHERFTRTHAVAFACIWASLALYTWDALARASRKDAPRVLVPAGTAGALSERPRAMSQNK
jgi:chloramphenicol-sensitive protein RarD